MKAKENYILREIADTYMLVPIGEELAHFNGMITLNEVGAFLWKCLKSEQTEASLVQAILSEYDTDESTARTDVRAFTALLAQHRLLQ